MSEKKITKKEMFNLIKGVEGLTDEMKSFIDHEIELLDKKNASKKPTKAQTENEGYKAEVLKVFEEIGEGATLTVTEILKASEVLKEFSTQKVSALCKLLEGDGLLVKVSDKKKTLYKVAEVEETED